MELLEVSALSPRTRAKQATVKAKTARSGKPRPGSAKSGGQTRFRKRTKSDIERAVVLQRLGIAVFVAAAAVALLLVPARGYLAQRHEIAGHRAELTDLKRQNQELTKRRDRLDDPSEIQRIARRDYGLVLEGEESYSILPPASAGLVLPRVWPYNLVQEPLEQATLAPS